MPLQLLNSPGNFTASKLAWVERNEPEVYHKTDKVMFPGDFISMKLTANAIPPSRPCQRACSGIFSTSETVERYNGFLRFRSYAVPVAGPGIFDPWSCGESVASALSLKPGIPVGYKAGDQPNNALSLNVLKPGEAAATAGTSGDGVSDKLSYDTQSRINSFAHVNHEPGKPGSASCFVSSMARAYLTAGSGDLTGKPVFSCRAQRSRGCCCTGVRRIDCPALWERGRTHARQPDGRRPASTDRFQPPRHRATWSGLSGGYCFFTAVWARHHAGRGVNPSVIRAGKANLS